MPLHVYDPQTVRRIEIPEPDNGAKNLGVPTVTDHLFNKHSHNDTYL